MKPSTTTPRNNPPEELYPVYRKDKTGYMNAQGEMIIPPPQFDRGYVFKENLARVKVGGKYGFIDRTGNYAIPPEYENAKNFSEGLAAVKKDGKWGFIDEKGEMVIAPQFSNVTNFKYGMAGAMNSRRNWALIDKSGKWLTKAKYDEVIMHPGDPFYEENRLIILKFKYDDEDYYQYVNEERKIFPGMGYYGAEKFREGLAPVLSKENWKWGYMDPTGKIVIPPKFNTAGRFYEGLAKVEMDGLCGYIDKHGKTVIPPKYEAVTDFGEGLAIVWLNTDNGIKCGIIDKSGKWLYDTEQAYDIYYNIDGERKSFKEGMAKVAKEHSDYYTWGFINQKGKEVIPPVYDDVKEFQGNMAAVQKGVKWGFVDKEGRWVHKPGFYALIFLLNGNVWVWNGKKWGLLDNHGKYIRQAQFDKPLALDNSGNLFLIRKNKKYGIMDANGRYVLEAGFDLLWDKAILFFPDENEKNVSYENLYPFLHFVRGGKEYIVNRQGETVAIFDV